MKPPGPVDVRPLFPPLGAELVALLRSLDAAAWKRPATPRWTVHDVAAHLLDTAIRRLSIGRDGHWPPPPPAPLEGFADTVSFLDGLNADWARVAPRFSPRLLTDLLEAGEGWSSASFATLPLDAPALFPVGWAGVDGGTMWLDLGREYTERWHHQQQIRDAVGAPPLDAPRWIDAVLAVAVRALPRAWRSVGAAVGTRVEVRAGAAWTLRREPDGWELLDGTDGAPAAAGIDTDGFTAARLFHHLAVDEAAIRRAGDPALTAPFVDARAVMAGNG